MKKVQIDIKIQQQIRNKSFLSSWAIGQKETLIQLI